MRILSLDGGGYLGLGTAAFLAEMERHFGDTQQGSARCHDCFDVFAGTSTGAIIAVCLAKGMSASQVVDLYKELGPVVFGRPRSRLKRAYHAKFSNEALRSQLESALGETTVGDVRALGKRVFLTAFNLTTGKPRIFKTDTKGDLNVEEGPVVLSLDDQHTLVDIALASSAAPVFLPAVKLTNPVNDVTEVFCDGGVFANHPAALTYIEALYQLGTSPKDVRLLSVATPRRDLSGLFGDKLDLGLLDWGTDLVSILIDGNSMISDTLMERLVKVVGGDPDQYRRVVLNNKLNIKLDDVSPHGTNALIGEGAGQAREGKMRSELADFFDPQRTDTAE